MITSVTKISIPSAVVYYCCVWYTYFRNGRYCSGNDEKMRYIMYIDSLFLKGVVGCSNAYVSI